MEIYKEQEILQQHRDMIHVAEVSRLRGETVYTQKDVDAKIERLFHSCERNGTVGP